MNWRLGLLTLVLILPCRGQQAHPRKQLAFNPASYPTGKFHVTQDDYYHGGLTLRVIEVKGDGRHSTAPSFCRAWLDVRNADQLVKRLYYADIEPVGFSFGVFVPRRQPLEDYFIAVKEGDYDGRLLLVGKDGTVTDLPGGFYFVTADKRFLVSERASDSPSLVVVDLAKRRTIIDTSKDSGIPESFNYYRDSSGYFFTEASNSNGSWNEIRDHVFRLDLEQHRIVRSSMTARALSSAHRVPYDFDPRSLKDCYAREQ